MISGTVNVILLSLIIYWSAKEGSPAPYMELKPAMAYAELAEIKEALLPIHSSIAEFDIQQGSQAPLKPIMEPVLVGAPPKPPIKEAAKKTVAVTKAPLSKTPPQPAKIAQKNPDKKHLVQDGDTLWKISRKYNVNVDQLKASNKLESDTLRPGKTLKIP
jgi:LysM repeat protein